MFSKFKLTLVVWFVDKKCWTLSKSFSKLIKQGYVVHIPATLGQNINTKNCICFLKGISEITLCWRSLFFTNFVYTYIALTACLQKSCTVICCYFVQICNLQISNFSLKLKWAIAILHEIKGLRQYLFRIFTTNGESYKLISAISRELKPIPITQKQKVRRKL